MGPTAADDEDAVSVTLVTQFFHPDSSANAGILSDLATGLSDRGVAVDVVAAQPWYASADREGRAPRTEEYQGVHVHRVRSTRFDKESGLTWRVLNELSFFLAAMIHLLVRNRDADVLLLPTGPSYLPVLGWLLDTLGDVTYVPIVFDLYPDMAVELGYLDENGILYRLWTGLNRRTFRAADRVVTIGETMAETIERRYPGTDTAVVHNWADGEWIVPQEKADNPFAARHDLVDRTTLLYSGNLGRHHELDSLIEAAADLKDDYGPADLTLLFIGEGGAKQRLQKRATDLDLEIVRFLPYQPREMLPDSLTCGDVAVVSMKAGVEGLCVSSKFYTALASGQAILAIATPDCEIGRIVDRTDVGIRVDPDSPGQLVEAISRLHEQPDETERMGRAARDLFEEEFQLADAIDRYRDIVEAVAADRRAATVE